jgi:hypothetical protein
LLRLKNQRPLHILPFSDSFPSGRFVPKLHTKVVRQKWYLRVDLPGVPDSEVQFKNVGANLALSGIRCDEIYPGSLEYFSVLVHSLKIGSNTQNTRLKEK